MTLFKEYSDMFGKPNEGLHSYRFLDTAIIDYILAILLAIFISFMTNIPLVMSTIGVLLIGEIAHYLFGVETNTVKKIT